MSRLAPLVLAALLGACATPIPPSGGPVDTTPPTLVSSQPTTAATRVADSTITLTFSERLDPTARTAVSVAPVGDTPPQVSVRGRDVTITLPELRPATTYVVTVGTTLKDNHGVALQAPITFAFATGDTIDRGQIAGIVRSPETGAGAPLAVWAYALADSASAPATSGAPDYRTETGADGAFALEYLRPGPYAVVAVQDRNRNLRADPGETFAVSPRRVLRADTARAEPAPFWVTALDSIPPRAQRIRPVSSRRFSVRFDEPVQLLDVAADAWTVADSASGRRAEVGLYQPRDAPFEVFVETDAALAPVPHRVSYRPGSPPALADSAGRAAAPFDLSFTPPARPDTVQARFLGFAPGTPRDTVTVLRPSALPSVRFNAPLADPTTRIAVKADGERLETTFRTTDGVSYQPARPDSAALPATFEIAVQTPDSTYRQRFAVAGERDTGGLVGRVEVSSTQAAPGAPVWVEARPASGERVLVRAQDDGTFAIQGLLPGPYTLRAWADLDGDGRWSGGALAPYQAPEPLALVLDPLQVRARWDTEVPPITL